MVNLEFIIGVLVVVLGGLGTLGTWLWQIFLENKKDQMERGNRKMKLYKPFIMFLYDFDSRLKKILDSQEPDWFNSKYLNNIKKKKGFAVDPNQKGYYILSSIYLVASFFAYAEIIQKDVEIAKYKIKVQKKKKQYKEEINYFHPNVLKICGLFRDSSIFKNYLESNDFSNPTDASDIRRHFQHSIGEMMLKKDKNNEFVVKTFKEFFDSYIVDKSFSFWLSKIDGLFVDLPKFDEIYIKNDIRPFRIIAIQYWCRKLMEKIFEELDIKEKPESSKKVLDRLNDKYVQEIIKNYQQKASTSELMGI